MISTVLQLHVVIKYVALNVAATSPGVLSVPWIVASCEFSSHKSKFRHNKVKLLIMISLLVSYSKVEFNQAFGV